MAFKIAILISGRGSNMEKIIKACKNNKLKSTVIIVVSNKTKVEGIAKSNAHGIENLVIDDLTYTKKEFEILLNKVLIKKKIDLICLAGFMRVLSKSFVKKWPKKILNIHPSLLPAFKGLNPQKMAIESGVKFSGCTVHFVNEKVDGGEIIDQEIVKIDIKDNEKTLSKKILMKEHKLYINVIRNLENKYGKSKQ